MTRREYPSIPLGVLGYPAADVRTADERWLDESDELLERVLDVRARGRAALLAKREREGRGVAHRPKNGGRPLRGPFTRGIGGRLEPILGGEPVRREVASVLRRAVRKGKDVLVVLERAERKAGYWPDLELSVDERFKNALSTAVVTTDGETEDEYDERLEAIFRASRSRLDEPRFALEGSPPPRTGARSVPVGVGHVGQGRDPFPAARAPSSSPPVVVAAPASGWERHARKHAARLVEDGATIEFPMPDDGAKEWVWKRYAARLDGIEEERRAEGA